MSKASDIIARLRAQRQRQNQRFATMQDRFQTQMANSIPANQLASIMTQYNPYARMNQPNPYEAYFAQMQQAQQQPQYQQPQADQPQQLPDAQPQPQDMNANYVQAFGGGRGVYYTPVAQQPAPQMQQATPQPQMYHQQAQPTPQSQPSPQPPVRVPQPQQQQAVRPTQGMQVRRPRANLIQQSKPMGPQNRQNRFI